MKRWKLELVNPDMENDIIKFNTHNDLLIYLQRRYKSWINDDEVIVYEWRTRHTISSWIKLK